jgi:hypothetical protein
MTLNTSSERRALTEAEWEAVEPSHYPALCTLERDQVIGLRVRVREMRNKARDRLNRQRRELRGKAAPRGAQPVEGDAGSALKLRVLSGALKRLNKEADRIQRGAGRRSQAALSRKALETKNAGQGDAHHPRSEGSAHAGMNPIPNRGIAPSGALNEEGHRPVLERSKKAR